MTSRIRKPHWRLGLMLAAAAALMFAFGSATPTQAAFSWMSKVRYFDDATGQELGYLEWQKDAASTTAVFDAVISLHNNPQGDDDWTKTSTNPDDSDQRKYEEIIKYWADSIYESTNGTHQLGTVRIFRNGKQSKIADVVWNSSEWPRANLSGYGTDGKRIMFGDTFPDGCGTGCDKDMLADADGAGYTLGHEWGHYVLGVYDEYKGDAGATSHITSPRSTDVPVDPAIMHSQWKARGGNYEWLNFSTSDNIGDVNKTAQGRAYGASCWETLIRDASKDPKDGDRKALPKRTYYSNLKGQEPTAADNWVKKQLPGDQAKARNKLDIIWMADEVAMQVVIDRSGSMSGSPITNAKKAAQTLVDVTQDGKTAMGVVSFNNNVTQDQAITEIPDPGDAVKTTIKNVIGGLTAGGTTAVYDAANTALSNLNTWHTANSSRASKVVFLLSDGGDNASSASEGDVISNYKGSKVPLFTFGYGSGAPGGTLSNMADQTGGKFYASPTTLAEIQAAFLAANTAVSSATTLVGGSSSAPSGGAFGRDFYVDDTIASLSIVTSFTGAVGDVTFSLRGPNGPLTETLTCTAAGGEVSCTGDVPESTITSEGAGTYQVLATNTTGAAVDVSINVTGNPKDQARTFDVTVATLGGSTVQYPQPVILTATVSQGIPITGVNLAAVITKPDGTTVTLQMNDEGKDGDGTAGDGVYSALWASYDPNLPDSSYSVEVMVDNDAGTAQFTGAGFQPVHYSPNTEGGEPAPPTYPALQTNFDRTGSTSFIVPGFAVPVQGSIATAVDLNPLAQAPDNTDNPGRIDSAGEENYYRIHDIDTSQDLVVRVTDLGLGLTKPVLKIYKANGDQYGSAADNVTSWNGYVYRMIPKADLDTMMYANVSDEDDTAVGGVFNISAGPAVPSDTQVTPGAGGQQPVPGGDPGGGGGCFLMGMN